MSDLPKTMPTGSVQIEAALRKIVLPELAEIRKMVGDILSEIKPKPKSNK